MQCAVVLDDVFHKGLYGLGIADIELAIPESNTPGLHAVQPSRRFAAERGAAGQHEGGAGCGGGGSPPVCADGGAAPAASGFELIKTGAPVPDGEVGELVLTRNQLLEISRRNEDSEFKVPLQRLSNVTAELQEGVMKTRMQPIGNAWQKLPRIVRDLSSELGKQIELEMHGAETELDRQVLDLIKDPLTHLIRNAIDFTQHASTREVRITSRRGMVGSRRSMLACTKLNSASRLPNTGNISLSGLGRAMS